jgi:hypothetical protein
MFIFISLGVLTAVNALKISSIKPEIAGSDPLNFWKHPQQPEISMQLLT